MTWSFLTPCDGQKPKAPVANPEDKILVEPNDRGGWGLRFDGDPAEQRFGNYPTPEDAARIARTNCTNVEVVEPKQLPVGERALPGRSVAARLGELGIPNI